MRDSILEKNHPIIYTHLNRRDKTLFRKLIFSAALLTALTVITATSARAEVSFGADLMSRYVWRGADFGNSASIQPGISYSTGPIEVGAWSAWGLTGASDGNENDLYITLSTGPVGITVTDYFFPAFDGDEFFDYGDKGGHTLEISVSFASGPISLMGAVNLLEPEDDEGKTQNSFYAEIGYDLGEIDDIGIDLTAGLGNDDYTTDTDPMLVSLGINLSKGDYTASYILNPDRETTFLVFGKSF